MSYNSTQITTEALAVTKSDSTKVSFFGLYVGGTGDVTVKTSKQGPGGATVTFPAVPAGSILPICVCMVMSTGTTATNIVGFGPV
jgi:hypothetical protein